LGCHLWNLTGDNVISKRRRSLLPVLTALFLVSYGLLTMLVVEQGRTIESQSNLIHALFGDSVQLSGIKGKAIQKQQAEARAQAQKKSSPAQTMPSTPQSQSAPTQGLREEAKKQNASKFGKPLPQRPPKESSDPGDMRRTLLTI
jgi:hypothetical protein